LDPNAAIVEKTGDILIADSGNQRIRRVVAATGTIMTIAGTGTPGFDADGVPAHQAKLSNPVAIALGPSGDLFIADSTNHRIRRVDLNSGVISTAVGTGTPGFAGDGGAATQAQLATPTGVAIDTDGNLYIADHDNQRVRRVDAKTGLITSIAGKGIPAAAERAVP
jgi:sugar lactone lactonase YvrE